MSQTICILGKLIMIKKSIFYIICLVLACQSLSYGQKEVKIMTWNIWHGGLHGAKSDDFVQDTANTLNVQRVIEQHNPDILFMQETYCCGMDIARNAGYKYAWRASSNLSIHSKYPIVDTLAIFNRGYTGSVSQMKRDQVQGIQGSIQMQGHLFGNIIVGGAMKPVTAYMMVII